MSICGGMFNVSYFKMQSGPVKITTIIDYNHRVHQSFSLGSMTCKAAANEETTPQIPTNFGAFIKPNALRGNITSAVFLAKSRAVFLCSLKI